MKQIRTLIALFALFLGTNMFAQTNLQAGTVVIKHPAADNSNSFFAGSNVYNFEVYKPGGAEAMAKIVAAFQSDPAVQAFSVGTLTGDYQAFTLVLKSKKNKNWFIAAFKAAGLNQVRINRSEPVTVDKL